MNVVDQLKAMGYTTINESWYNRVDEWRQWYKGNVPEFHGYRVWNGQSKVKCTRYSLGMAKKVCEDWANLLMNEKVQITLEGDKEQTFIDEVFTANNFEVSVNELQERGAAAGTYAIIPRITRATVDQNGTVLDGGEIILDYITAENIYPLAWSGREITECAFTSTVNSRGKTYLYMQLHTKENGLYQIRNVVYEDLNGCLKQANFADVPGMEAVSDAPILTGSETPQFVIGRYNIVNNVEDNCPMGIAVYANAIDQIKSCDVVYDSYVNEFILGKKRVMVKPSATKNIDGENVFDPSDVTFYVLPEDVTDGAVIQPVDMSLRVDEHQNGLQAQLDLLSAKCGFGERHYKFDSGNVSTATQIISENSTLFRTVKKHEILLEALLIKLCRIILRMGNTYMRAGLNEDVEISVDFDDSIIIDKEQEEAKVYRMLSAGLMKAEEARSILMNEDIDTARKALPRVEDLTKGEEQNEIE